MDWFKYYNGFNSTNQVKTWRVRRIGLYEMILIVRDIYSERKIKMDICPECIFIIILTAIPSGFNTWKEYEE